MPRRIEPELLDGAPDGVAAQNLRELTFLNRWFGGHAILRRTLGAVLAPGEAATIVDVGAASGDMARVARAAFPRATVICLDWQLRNLKLAPSPRLVADAFALPLADKSVDVVMMSLFLHHFPDAQVVELLAGFRRVARRAVIVQDLERHWIAERFLPATRWLFGWSDIVLHDGPVSVRAAFTAGELTALARSAGAEQPEVRAHGLAFRLSAILRK